MPVLSIGLSIVFFLINSLTIAILWLLIIRSPDESQKAQRAPLIVAIAVLHGVINLGIMGYASFAQTGFIAIALLVVVVALASLVFTMASIMQK